MERHEVYWRKACEILNRITETLTFKFEESDLKKQMDDILKKIFIENYNNIFENSTIITIREIERFINDKETCYLIYNSLDSIIKKLCTYDRASLISILKNKENGIDKIRTNLEYLNISENQEIYDMINEKILDEELSVVR